MSKATIVNWELEIQTSKPTHHANSSCWWTCQLLEMNSTVVFTTLLGADHNWPKNVQIHHF